MTDFEKKQAGALKYEKLTGTKFGAAMYVAHLARNYAEAHDNYTLHSEAVTWALTGEVPKSAKDYENGRYRSRERTDALDRVKYIDDREVRDAVYATIRDSRANSHLIYNYNGVQDASKRSRIRVVSNIVWDQLVRESIDSKYFG